MTELLQFKEHALWFNLAVFCAAAVVVWISGTRVSRYADAISGATGIGRAAIGLLLIAGITSLPELAVTLTASIGGNAQLAVNNLLGSIAMQVAILAIGDALIGRDALTSVIVKPVVLLQLALNNLLLALFAGAALIGDIAFLGVGAWSCALAAAYVGSIWVITKSQAQNAWSAQELGRGERRRRRYEIGGAQEDEQPLSTLVWKTVAAGAAILAAGFLLSRTGEGLAAQTGLGQSFGGFALVAISTSLPEVSTVIGAVRLGRYAMAVSNIFGTNLFNVGLIFVVDVAYRGGAVLNEIGEFSIFAALLGIVVTTIFMVGLVERRDRTIARMGIDSFAVLLAYLGGLAALYTLR